MERESIKKYFAVTILESVLNSGMGWLSKSMEQYTVDDREK